jgi:hypothetical protein
MQQVFKITQNLFEQGTQNFLGFCRYASSLSEEVDSINELKMKAIKEYKEMKESNSGQNKKIQPPAIIKGYIPAISLQNELSAWKLVQNIIQTQIKRYPTTLSEDLEILEKNLKSRTLS